MERDEAERLRSRLESEHPDRRTHSFILSERDGVWEVAKVALPPGPKATGAQSPGPEPLHSHDAGKLPGGLPPWSAGA